jgi:predicted P-loop ATPase
VFAATSESSAYLEYPDGRRRYWPLHCGEINTSLLHAMREQLFAEAYRAYQAGELWYVMPGSTSEEQLDRVTDDTWSRSIGEYCAQRDGEKLHSTDLLYHVGVELKDQNDGHKRRITKIMISLGWEQKVDKIQGRSVRMWRRST